MFAYKAVVFDLDGTLLDTCHDIAGACNRALLKAGLPTRSIEQIVSFVGNGARALVMKAAGFNADDSRLEELVDSYLCEYEKTPYVTTTWLPFAKETLDQLIDIPTALYTNKPRAITLKLLEAMDATHYFKVIVAGGDVRYPKPNPEGLLFIAETLKINPEDMVMVGDGPQDIESAERAGATSISVCGGYNATDMLRARKPDVLLPNMQQLVQVLRTGAQTNATQQNV